MTQRKDRTINTDSRVPPALSSQLLNLQLFDIPSFSLPQQKNNATPGIGHN